MNDLSGIKLVNIHHKVPYDIYIGRPSNGQPDNIWKNPYKVVDRTDEARNEVIAKHKKYLWGKLVAGEITVEMIMGLKDKTLACFCASKDPNVKRTCHGDNYVSAINFLINNDIKTQEEFYSWLEDQKSNYRK